MYFIMLRPFSLAECFETYEPFISLIFLFFSGRDKTRADTDSADIGARLYFKILVFLISSVNAGVYHEHTYAKLHLRRLSSNSRLSGRPNLATVLQNCIDARQLQTFLLFDLPKVSCSNAGYTTSIVKFANPET
jgi:hypothetical protein